MIKGGALDKYGKPNEKTPAKWLNNYVDYAANAPGAEGGQSSVVVKEEPQELLRKVGVAASLLGAVYRP